MRIVLVSDWYAEKMGYAENCLPKALASLGHDVHLVTSNVQIYFNEPFYKEVYEPFIGPAIVESGVMELDGYTIHRLPIGMWWKRLHIIKGFLSKIHELRPQIVQNFSAISSIAIELAIAKPFLNYKLFTEVHTVGSVYPPLTKYAQMGKKKKLRLRLFDTLPGRLVSFFTTKCYPATVDAAEIAVRFFGVQKRKISICSLGVDTDLFHPVAGDNSNEERKTLRKKLGFSESDIACIYTGRFTKDKNPLCLAQAIAGLASKGAPFRGLFFGSGPQMDEIRACSGCVVRPFVLFQELPAIFRVADIGVWPRQESMSMLDAAACGIPIVISNKVLAVERVQGNGLTYNENDPVDLMRALQVLQDIDRRKHLGRVGAAKIEREYSWVAIARRRIADYEAALQD
jgi:glycosyltransferase involved in cell wall biosynthesis